MSRVPATLAAVPPQVRVRPLELRDDRTSLVRTWQALLAAKGYALAADGAFGPKTLHATLAAQQWAGVAADGLVGPRTWAAVAAKQRTRRPGTTVRNTVVVAAGGAPKIIDARPGRNGFPDGPGQWQVRGVPYGKLGHHTGGPGSFVADARFHTQSSYLTAGGAPALAYHVGIDADGSVLVFNDWRYLTWHCDGGQNQRWLGVVLRGNTDRGSLTAAQRRSLRWLWARLEAGTFRPFKAEAPWPQLLPSTTHRHVNSTSCPGTPGEALYRQLSSRFEP